MAAGPMAPQGPLTQGPQHASELAAMLGWDLLPTPTPAASAGVPVGPLRCPGAGPRADLPLPVPQGCPVLPEADGFAAAPWGAGGVLWAPPPPHATSANGLSGKEAWAPRENRLAPGVSGLGYHRQTVGEEG